MLDSREEQVGIHNKSLPPPIKLTTISLGAKERNEWLDAAVDVGRTGEKPTKYLLRYSGQSQ